MPNVNTPYATLSFANIFKARPKFDGQKPVYSCSLIFDPTQQKSAAYKALQDACIEVAKAKFGDNVNLKNIKMPFRDAGEKTYDGYHPGHTFISPWSANKPGVVDTNLQDILLPEEVWSGQLVRANVSVYAYDTSGKKGVSLGLNHLQIIQSEGRDRLDGRPSAGSAFDDGAVKEMAKEPF